MKIPSPEKSLMESKSIKTITAFLSLIFLTGAVLYYSLDLRAHDLSIPFNYSGDSIIIALHIKGLIEDGWPYAISNLSAPFTYPAASFPLLTSTDWVLMKIVSIFTEGTGSILNIFWLLTFFLSSASAFITFKLVGLKNTSSVLGALIYAFLPYAFLRNVSHLNLSYYLVPFCCLSIFIITTQPPKLIESKTAKYISLIGLTLLGFNYIYYSYFCVILLAFSIAYAIASKHTGTQIKFGVVALGILVTSTALNLSQYYYSLKENGAPVQMDYKRIAESEIYGAKLRTMLLPHPDNKISIIRHVAEKSLKANYPLENENSTARLGLLASTGFIISLGTILFRRNSPPPPQNNHSGISSIVLITFLLMTVGGIGSIINLVTIPDFRAYNRLSIFIAFFSVYVFFQAGESLISKNLGIRSFAIRVTIFMVFALSIYDQCLDRVSVIRDRETDISQAISDRSQVRYLESILPPGSKILQLPLTGYPPLERHHKMWSYDHGRPAIWGDHFRWSWPSFSKSHREWQNKLSKLRGPDFLDEIALSKFDAVWIDRRGFPDNGTAIVKLFSENGWASTKKISGSIDILTKPSDPIVFKPISE